MSASYFNIHLSNTHSMQINCTFVLKTALGTYCVLQLYFIAKYGKFRYSCYPSYLFFWDYDHIIFIIIIYTILSYNVYNNYEDIIFLNTNSGNLNKYYMFFAERIVHLFYPYRIVSDVNFQ